MPAGFALVAGCLALAASSASFAQEGIETFEIGLSTSTISISSDFTGARLVVFGALDNADAKLLRQQRYDIVVVLVGPRSPAVVREKERTFGLWINRGSETFDAVPGSYALAATRPLADIARQELRQRLSLGIADLRLDSGATTGAFGQPAPDKPEEAKGQVNISLAERRAKAAQDIGGTSADAAVTVDDYAEALKRIRRAKGLYNQSVGTVQFVSPTLFRADLNLPADLPTGTHMARAYLFRSGVFIRESSEPLFVRKSGFESYIDDMATRYGVFYGMAAVLLAIFTGWFGRLVFKRD
ncbi:TIGR02186 family protein [Jiella avicenniae]|uniref:TIGR02186 family protein n=1 Tax=Jiella avicenniae TaxID=2907202 RepID=A0A9X1P3X2_9HYPH|nr:TIGR02186 family protein [Jiella avicenniae]MCE7029384.1 TIGR02186 family protein [Jiella avicenniae]